MARPIAFRHGEAGVSLALLALALYVIATSRTMPAGTVALPGPGFVPAALGILLAVISVLLLLRSRQFGEDARTVDFSHRKVGVVIVALAALALAFEPVRAIPALAVFLFILILVLAQAPWWKATFWAAFGAGLTWLVFVYLLGVLLPKA